MVATPTSVSFESDREADFEMGVDLVVVSIDVGGVDAEADKVMVDELPRAGPFLPVDEADVLARQVLEAFDIQGVVGGHEKAQLPVVEVHDHGLDVGRVYGQEGDVVFARIPDRRGATTRCPCSPC